MTPERWRQVTALFHSARARPAADRPALLDDACARDPSLRADVERLLAADDSHFGEASVALASLPALSSGTTLGPYRIEGLIGVGGMGQVYRATDTRLHRHVALKVLLPDVAFDPDFEARFEREARLLATLNHPNIAAIHDLEEADGLRVLVLEFVDGVTLADRLARGALTLVDTLAVARQIAAALEAAHQRGIVHRDLKPANITISVDGAVKVLDFGIARVVTGDAAGGSTASSTRTGLVLGTPAYMSPEQARGVAVDKRTDIWAFGCVLFEMLAGQGAFTAATASDSLAKVIDRDPDWRALPAAVPESIRRLVRRCLQKDPANRLHDIADARIEIGEAQAAASRDEETSVFRRLRQPVVPATLAVAALILSAAAIRAFLPRDHSAGQQAMEFGVTFPNNYIPTDGVAISPDGRRIAANVWSNVGDIWLHSLDVDGAQPRPLPGGEQAAYPFWSPDSSSLGFFQGDQIVTMSATGGRRTIVAKYGGPGVSGGSWNRENVILFSSGGALFRVGASGGSAPVAVPITGVTGRLVFPVFLPDGRHFVVCANTPDGGALFVASLDDARGHNVGASQCPGGFAPPDHVLFLRGGAVVAQTLDLRRLTTMGEPTVVASNVVRGSLGPWPVLTVSASNTGALAFPAPRGGGSPGKLTWFDRSGQIVGAIEPLSEEVEYLNPEICPTNDALVAAHRFDPATGAWHIWLIDGARGNVASRLTSDPASDFDPAWSRDGTAIIYVSDRDGHRKMYRQSIAGGPPSEVMTVDEFKDPIPSDIGPDGLLLFSDLQRSIWAFRPGDPARKQLGLPHSYGPHLSPDGKWLAYAVSQGGAFELYVERFPGGSPRRKISAEAGAHPRWTSSGREVVYWTPPGGIVSTEVDPTDQDIRVGQTRTLVSAPVLSLIDARTAYDITRDGRRILVRQQAGPPTPGIRVIVNWMARLK